MGWTAALVLVMLQAAPAPDNRATIESALGDRLLDGESARWRWFPVKQLPDGTTVMCGFVNSKNRMGGYTGFNPVWVSARGETILAYEIAEGPILDGVAAKRCIGAGFDMPTIPPGK